MHIEHFLQRGKRCCLGMNDGCNLWSIFGPMTWWCLPTSHPMLCGNVSSDSPSWCPMKNQKHNVDSGQSGFAVQVAFPWVSWCQWLLISFDVLDITGWSWDPCYWLTQLIFRTTNVINIHGGRLTWCSAPWIADRRLLAIMGCGHKPPQTKVACSLTVDISQAQPRLNNMMILTTAIMTYPFLSASFWRLFHSHVVRWHLSFTLSCAILCLIFLMNVIQIFRSFSFSRPCHLFDLPLLLLKALTDSYPTLSSWRESC